MALHLYLIQTAKGPETDDRRQQRCWILENLTMCLRFKPENVSRQAQTDTLFPGTSVEGKVEGDAIETMFEANRYH